jgi:hypothetical protein
MVLLARGLRTRVGLPCVSRQSPMSGSVVLDAAGRRRSPATMPGFHAGHPPRNKGLRYPADPPIVGETVAVMRIAGDGGHGRRLPGLIVVLWRAGLRIDEALALPWLIARVALPIGPLFCVISGRTRGRPWTTTGARAELRRTAARAGVRRRFAPHRLRHAHAVEMAREGVPLNRHPTPARPQQPRHCLGLSAGHRQRRDHRDRPRAPRPNGAGHHLAASLTGNVALRTAARPREPACPRRGVGTPRIFRRRYPAAIAELRARERRTAGSHASGSPGASGRDRG